MNRILTLTTNIISLFPNTHMKNISTKTIGILFVVGLSFLGIATAYGQMNRDYKSEAQSLLQSAEETHGKAQELYCQYIGSLTQKCYAKNAEACGALQVAETDYQTEFSAEAYLDCFSEAPADVHPIVPEPGQSFLEAANHLPR